MKILRLGGGVLLATLGALALGALGRFPSPDLFLLPVAAAARRGDPYPALFTGLAAGLIQDSLTVPGRLFGLNTFTKILAGYLLATIGARVLVEKALPVAGLLAATVLIESSTVALLLWILRGEPLLPSPFALAVRAAATGVAGAALHLLSRYPWRDVWERRRRRRVR